MFPIFFPLMIDGLHGYATEWSLSGIHIVYTMDNGITWDVCTSGVTVGFYGLIGITFDSSGVHVADGDHPVYNITSRQVAFVEGHDMAGEMDPSQVVISFQVLDELGTTANAIVYATFPNTATITEILADAETLAAALDAASDGQIVKYQVHILAVPVGAEKAAPVEGSRVEYSGVFNLTNAANPRRWGSLVPSIADALVVGGKIVISAGAAQAWYKLLDGETALATGTATNSSFVANSGFYDAFLSFRKHRKQLLRSSREVKAV